MFSKSLNEVTAIDVQQVVADAVQEDSEVEFKETLPSKDGLDPWFDAQARIGDRARNELLSEVIAFANAYGGTLLLGVAETDMKPARARKIVPLPKCVELAERLRLQCRDCIEPQIPLLGVAAVLTTDDGAGLVVFRVPRSRLAPHRHTVTRECYVRRADRTEKMTMREIQDLTLQVERGISAIEARFEARRQPFAASLEAFRADKRDTLGIRATAVPLVPLAVDRLQKNEAVRPPLIKLFGSIREDPVVLLVPAYHIGWRSILRGMSGTGGHDDFRVDLQVHSDGLIEYSLFFVLSSDPRSALYPIWVMGIVGNVLCAVERFRRGSHSPDVEYGLEFEIWNRAGALRIAKYGGVGGFDTLGPFPAGRTIFPRYSVGGPSEFVALSQLIEHDFWNAAGHTFDEVVTIDFQQAFKNLGLE